MTTMSFAYGEPSREGRREAEKVNEVCDEGKAGDEGPVMGGVELRYELPKDCDVALGRASWC
jgi:hypothetical protein